ncbi:hypothetical protein V6N11_017582 [Hibiscus sabdariffa]|uniref:Uncharacterized protein n=1 Tax=Hibiscus sabdariffa TaxID=183260 RepID=A0ABR2TYF7_9ROSI
MGLLSLFLDIEAISTSTRLFHSWAQYIYNILTQFQMENAKAISTSMSSSNKLPSSEPSTTIDISRYGQLLVAARSLLVQHIPSKAQVVDTLTKPLGRNLFLHFRSKIGVSDGSSILRGGTLGVWPYLFCAIVEVDLETLEFHLMPSSHWNGSLGLAFAKPIYIVSWVD